MLYTNDYDKSQLHPSLGGTRPYWEHIYCNVLYVLDKPRVDYILREQLTVLIALERSEFFPRKYNQND